MTEIWLKTNRRALCFGAAFALLLGCAGAVLGTGLFGRIENGILRLAGWLLVSLALLMLANLAWQSRRPRLAYEPGRLLVFLRSGGPIRVPLEIVEGFLLGQAPGLLPGKRLLDAPTSSVVIRLAERAEEWAMVEVKPALGSWCGHYVTLRGTWCEPLSVDLVHRLNARLAEVKRQPHGGQPDGSQPRGRQAAT